MNGAKRDRNPKPGMSGISGFNAISYWRHNMRCKHIYFWLRCRALRCIRVVKSLACIISDIMRDQ